MSKKKHNTKTDKSFLKRGAGKNFFAKKFFPAKIIK